ncbi:hypothetical protein [Streptococcus sp. V940]
MKNPMTSFFIILTAIFVFISSF